MPPSPARLPACPPALPCPGYGPPVCRRVPDQPGVGQGHLATRRARQRQLDACSQDEERGGAYVRRGLLHEVIQCVGGGAVGRLLGEGALLCDAASSIRCASENAC